MFSDFTLSKFLLKNAEASFRGFVIAFFSFACIIIPELIYIQNLYKNEINEYLGILALALVSAFLYGVIFNLLFFCGRFLSIILSHVEKIWVTAIPGLITFFLIGQPFYFRFLPIFHLHTGENFYLTQILYFIFFAVTSLLILYKFPQFRGSNASFLFISTLCMRAIFFPFETLIQKSAPEYFLLYVLSLLILSFFLFAVLQNRFRQNLMNNYDYIPLPNTILSVAVTIFLTSFAAVFYFQDSFFNISGSINDIMFPEFIRILVFMTVLFSLQWVLTSIWIQYVHRKTKMQSYYFYHPTKTSIFKILMVILIGSGWGSYYTFSTRNENLASLLRKHNGILYEALYIFGTLTDLDKDGNSKWPGGDPDEYNSCVQINQTFKCDTNETDQVKRPFIFTSIPETDFTANVPIKQLRNCKKNDSACRKNIIKNPSNKKLILLTVFNAGEDVLFEDGTNSVLFFSQSEVFLSSDRSIAALRALFQNLNGFEELNGITKNSIITEFSRAGFRTICGGYDGGHSYLSTDQIYRFDIGCQIYLPESENKKNKSGFGQTINYMLKKFDDYKEASTFLWIHYHYDLITNLPQNSDKANAEIYTALEKLTKEGNVVLLLFNQSQPYFADSWLVSRREFPDLQDQLSLTDLINQASGNNILLSENKLISGITRSRFKPSWALLLRAALLDDTFGIIYTFRSNHIRLFDGITGASWFERTERSTPGTHN